LSSLLESFSQLRAYQSSLFTASTEQKAPMPSFLESFSQLRAYQALLFTASTEQKAPMSSFLESFSLLRNILPNPDGALKIIISSQTF
jgi:hypothetical protein